MFAPRIKDLLDSKLAREQDGMLSITAKGRLLAMFFVFMRFSWPSEGRGIVAVGFACFVLLLAATPLWIMTVQAFLTRVGFRGVSGQVAAMFASATAALPISAALWVVI